MQSSLKEAEKKKKYAKGAKTWFANLSLSHCLGRAMAGRKISKQKKNSQKISFCKKALLYLFYFFLHYKYVKQSLPLSYRYFFALAAAIAPLRRIPLIPPLEDEDGSELLFNPGGGPWSDMNLHRNW